MTKNIKNSIDNLQNKINESYGAGCFVNVNIEHITKDNKLNSYSVVLNSGNIIKIDINGYSSNTPDQIFAKVYNRYKVHFVRIFELISKEYDIEPNIKSKTTKVASEMAEEKVTDMLLKNTEYTVEKISLTSETGPKPLLNSIGNSTESVMDESMVDMEEVDMSAIAGKSSTPSGPEIELPNFDTMRIQNALSDMVDVVTGLFEKIDSQTLMIVKMQDALSKSTEQVEKLTEIVNNISIEESSEEKIVVEAPKIVSLTERIMEENDQNVLNEIKEAAKEETPEKVKKDSNWYIKRGNIKKLILDKELVFEIDGEYRFVKGFFEDGTEDGTEVVVRSYNDSYTYDLTELIDLVYKEEIVKLKKRPFTSIKKAMKLLSEDKIESIFDIRSGENLILSEVKNYTEEEIEELKYLIKTNYYIVKEK